MVTNLPSSRVGLAGPLRDAGVPSGVEGCKWFFADMTQEEGIHTLVTSAPDGGFVVVHTPRADAYILLVKEPLLVSSHLITAAGANASSGSYHLVGQSKTFASVPDLIGHYQTHPYGTDYEGNPRVLAGPDGAPAGASVGDEARAGNRVSLKIPGPPPEAAATLLPSYDDPHDKVVTVRIARPASGGGFGITFVGPGKEQDRGHGKNEHPQSCPRRQPQQPNSRLLSATGRDMGDAGVGVPHDALHTSHPFYRTTLQLLVTSLSPPPPSSLRPPISSLRPPISSLPPPPSSCSNSLLILLLLPYPAS